jgi:hypothetical protein
MSLGRESEGASELVGYFCHSRGGSCQMKNAGSIHARSLAPLVKTRGFGMTPPLRDAESELSIGGSGLSTL